MKFNKGACQILFPFSFFLFFYVQKMSLLKSKLQMSLYFLSIEINQHECIHNGTHDNANVKLLFSPCIHIVVVILFLMKCYFNSLQRTEPDFTRSLPRKPSAQSCRTSVRGCASDGPSPTRNSRP